MLERARKWHYPDSRNELAEEIRRELNLLPPVARVLVNRGIDSVEEARLFLNPSLESLHAPHKMKGMKQAVDRIVSALEKNEKILVFGDYDVDGITAAVMLTSALRLMGGNVDYYLPSRFDEGYGLQQSVIEEYREKGYSLTVTVDCGINAHAEVLAGKNCGMDIIVTDHHYPLIELEGAVSIINPQQRDCPYPWKSLAGVGIAFKLLCALVDKTGEGVNPFDYIDLVALGTVADIVPLTGENRVLTVYGLEKINKNPVPGIKALTEVQGVSNKKLSARDLAFILAPSINAAGRMGKADPAAGMFMADTEKEAGELAAFLVNENQNRRNLESSIYKEAKQLIEELYGGKPDGAIVLGKEDWHYGVIGIVASRLVDEYYCPVVLAAFEDETGKGSARSIPGFNISEALNECSDLLMQFGGHAQAAGLTVEKSCLDELRKKLSLLTRQWLKPEELVPQMKLDDELDGPEINMELAHQLEQIGPFGEGNEYPRFSSRRWEIQNWRLVGSDKRHLKLKLKKGNTQVEPIFFAAEAYRDKIFAGREIDLVFTLSNGTWQDRPILNMEIKDLSYADSFRDENVELIDGRNKRNKLNYLKEMLPSGEELLIYVGSRQQRDLIRNNIPGAERAGFIFPRLKELEGLEISDGCNLVFYHLPLRPEIMENIMRAFPREKMLKIHLLYLEKDMLFNQKIMEATLPTTASEIEDFYALIKRIAGEKRLLQEADLHHTPEAANFSSKMRRLNLQILEEIGCMEKTNEGWLLLSNDEKCGFRELEQSRVFYNCRELKKRCEEYEEYLLRTEPATLLSYIQDLRPAEQGGENKGVRVSDGH